MKHINIPLFVPHAGCKQQCSFCNQHSITGTRHEMTPERAVNEIETVLSSLPASAKVEIAFFGGSFTAIQRDKMLALLKAVQVYIERGRADAIRISTRPDAIDSEILNILESYHVRTIELGIQSMSDRVLTACRRGHTASDSIKACEMIVSRGFTLGGQMMIGLPESTPDDEVATAKAIVQLGAKEARIYPTVVFRNTELCRLTESGIYTPLSVSDAVHRTVNAMEVFEQASVKLLRIGLCDSEGLHDGSVAGGALHPAMGELCQSEYYRRLLTCALSQSLSYTGKPLTVSVARGRLSAAIGQHRCNILSLKEQFSLPSLRFRENERLSGYSFEITAESEQLCD